MKRRTFLKAIVGVLGVGIAPRNIYADDGWDFPDVPDDGFESLTGHGTALADFNDFVMSTGPEYLTGPQALLDEAIENAYTWAALMGLTCEYCEKPLYLSAKGRCANCGAVASQIPTEAPDYGVVAV